MAKYAWLRNTFSARIACAAETVNNPISVLITAGTSALVCGIVVSTQSLMVCAAIAVVLAIGIALPWLMVWQTEAVVHFGSRLVEGEAGSIRIRIRNRGFIPLENIRVLALDDAICSDGISMRPFEHREIVMPWTPKTRGNYPRATVEMVCGFPFNISSARRRASVLTPCLVWPRAAALNFSLDELTDRRGLASTEMNGELRSYRRGDSMKLIHPMQTARQDRLIVREPERKSEPSLSIVLDRCRASYRTEAENGDDEWESVVRTTAGLLTEAVTRNWRVLIDLGDQRISCNRRSIEQAMDALATITLFDQPQFDRRGGPDPHWVSSVLVTSTKSAARLNSSGWAASIVVATSKEGGARLVPAPFKTWRALAGSAS